MIKTTLYSIDILPKPSSIYYLCNYTKANIYKILERYFLNLDNFKKWLMQYDFILHKVASNSLPPPLPPEVLGGTYKSRVVHCPSRIHPWWQITNLFATWSASLEVRSIPLSPHPWANLAENIWIYFCRISAGVTSSSSTPHPPPRRSGRILINYKL